MADLPNPYDLRPWAAGLADEIIHIIKTTGEIPIIIFGEDHRDPRVQMQILALNLALRERLDENEIRLPDGTRLTAADVVQVDELPENFIQIEAGVAPDASLPTMTPDELREAMKWTILFGYTKYTHISALALCMAQAGLDRIFADAPRTAIGHILESGYNIWSAQGIDERNNKIAGITSAAHKQKKIAIIWTGVNHLLSNYEAPYDKKRFKTSLLSAMEAQAKTDGELLPPIICVVPKDYCEDIMDDVFYECERADPRIRFREMPGPPFDCDNARGNNIPLVYELMIASGFIDLFTDAVGKKRGSITRPEQLVAALKKQRGGYGLQARADLLEILDVAEQRDALKSNGPT